MDDDLFFIRAWCARAAQRRMPVIEVCWDTEATYSRGIRRPRRWFPRARYWTGRGLRRLAAWIDS